MWLCWWRSVSRPGQCYVFSCPRDCGNQSAGLGSVTSFRVPVIVGISQQAWAVLRLFVSPCWWRSVSSPGQSDVFWRHSYGHSVPFCAAHPYPHPFSFFFFFLFFFKFCLFLVPVFNSLAATGLPVFQSLECPSFNHWSASLSITGVPVFQSLECPSFNHWSASLSVTGVPVFQSLESL